MTALHNIAGHAVQLAPGVVLLDYAQKIPICIRKFTGTGLLLGKSRAAMREGSASLKAVGVRTWLVAAASASERSYPSPRRPAGWRGDPAVPLPFVVWLRCNASGLSWFRCSSSIWLRGRECAGPPRVTRFDGAARWAYDGLPVFQQALTAENELSATGPFESRDDLSE
ncbi:hypothetical protein NDU88_002999 [Pleurodeles waltl]|uniref:Uncharacterized protein n=1 Tax=Pleurodeles waltl TaxID=8319 RepID=A0AAV7VE44_PLEWA|nr:hypothetical protein NDU88_002999 [Pleurodeles waltl]